MSPGKNVPPLNPNHILELSNDDSAASSCPPKKVTGSSISTKPKGQHNQFQVDNTVDNDENEETQPPLKKKTPKFPESGLKKNKSKAYCSPIIKVRLRSDRYR